VLAVAPLAITRATTLRATTTTSTSTSTSTTAVTCRTGISVSIWVEGPDVSMGDPAGITIRRATRAEVGGVSVRPVATARTASRKTIRMLAKDIYNHGICGHCTEGHRSQGREEDHPRYRGPRCAGSCADGEGCRQHDPDPEGRSPGVRAGSR